jgi:shikimate 5-dehydrogenase
MGIFRYILENHLGQDQKTIFVGAGGVATELAASVLSNKKPEIKAFERWRAKIFARSTGHDAGAANREDRAGMSCSRQI